MIVYIKLNLFIKSFYPLSLIRKSTVKERLSVQPCLSIEFLTYMVLNIP
jgi:hypothetical protein